MGQTQSSARYKVTGIAQARVILLADIDGDEHIPEERGIVLAEQGDWVTVLVDRKYRNHSFCHDDGVRLVKWDRIAKEK